MMYDLHYSLANESAYCLRLFAILSTPTVIIVELGDAPDY